MISGLKRERKQEDREKHFDFATFWKSHMKIKGQTMKIIYIYVKILQKTGNWEYWDADRP